MLAKPTATLDIGVNVERDGASPLGIAGRKPNGFAVWGEAGMMAATLPRRTRAIQLVTREFIT